MDESKNTQIQANGPHEKYICININNIDNIKENPTTVLKDLQFFLLQHSLIIFYEPVKKDPRRTFRAVVKKNWIEKNKNEKKNNSETIQNFL
jgi:ABC-type molybdate transport system substrate-binding protein